MCTREDTLAHYLATPFIDDVMKHSTLITVNLPDFQRLPDLKNVNLPDFQRLLSSLRSS